MKRSIIQACSEAKRWEGYARAKGFKCDTQKAVFTRKDCRVEFINGVWRVADVTLSGLKEKAREDMLIAALKKVHGYA